MIELRSYERGHRPSSPSSARARPRGPSRRLGATGASCRPMRHMRSIHRGSDDQPTADTIQTMRREPAVPTTHTPPMAALPKDDSRLEMMRRVKQMSVEERVDLFERLSRRVAWARSAKRLR